MSVRKHQPWPRRAGWRRRRRPLIGEPFDEAILEQKIIVGLFVGHI